MLGERLVTWNVFFSASAYERHEPISWEVLDDFSNLVDLLCLYDDLRVLGDPKHPPFLTHQTPFFDAMREAQAVRVCLPNEIETADLARLTRRHLSLRLPSTDIRQLDTWVVDALKLNQMPSERERVATMNTSVRLNPPAVLSSADDSLERVLVHELELSPGLRPFVVRTFMYFAYAELHEIAFSPDTTRFPLLKVALTHEDDLASQLRERLQKQWQDYPSIGARDLRKRISPFAAVVLERCRGARVAIPGEILKLRQELHAVRQKIGEIERTILFGPHDSAIKAESDWTSILSEVEKTFGPSPQLVTFSKGLALAKEAGEVLDKPTEAKGWLAVLAQPIEVVGRLLRRRPVAHLHSLRAELPAPGRLLNAIHSVFPETRTL